MKSWKKDAGIVSNIVPDGVQEKTSLGDLTWHSADNPFTIRDFNADASHAQMMRGIITKHQRTLQYLKHYNSGFGDKGELTGFSMKLSGGDPKVNDGFVGKIQLNVDSKGEWNKDVLRQLSKDIQDIVDSATGFDARRFGRDGETSKWIDKFLFGDDYYKGVFKLSTWNPKTHQYEGSERITSEVHRDVVKAAIRPYQALLQLGTQVYNNGVKQSVRYEDIISYTSQYDRNVSSLGKHVYYSLKAKNKNSSDYMSRLNKLFAVDNKGRPKDKPFGDFGSNASVDKQNKTNLLPFERAMSSIAYNELKLDYSNNKLYGEAMNTFENTINLYENRGTEAKADAMKELVNAAKKDVRVLGFANYLEFQIRKMTKSMYRNPQFAEYLSEQISIKKEMLRDVENQFTGSKEITNRILHATALRIRSEILEGRSGKVKYATPYPVNGEIITFNSYWGAKKWVDKNYKHLLKFAKLQASDKNKGPFKFTGVNSESHLFNMTWGHMLGPYYDVHFMPEGNKGEYARQMSKDIREVKSLYYSLIDKYYNNKGREAWMNSTRINDRVFNIVDILFQKWNKVGEDYSAPEGLGQMFLMKLMAPKSDPTTITYFNGQMMPTYKKGSAGLVRFGLKYIAESKNVNELQKKRLFGEFASKSNFYHNMFYGQHLTAGFHDIQMMQMLHASHANAYHSLAPLLDGDMGKEFTPKSIQETDINPNLARMFGHSENMGVGWVLSNFAVSPKALGEMIRNAERSIMPAGYIPMDYIGKHPKIDSWNSWNQAKSNSLNIMFGDLTKGRLLYIDSPTLTKQPFTLSGSKPDTKVDIKDQINNKLSNEGKMNCK